MRRADVSLYLVMFVYPETDLSHFHVLSIPVGNQGSSP